jgi:hypothetical protein
MLLNRNWHCVAAISQRCTRLLHALQDFAALLGSFVIQ